MFTAEQRAELRMIYRDGRSSTRGFIEGLEILLKYHQGGEQDNVIHAEHEELMIYVSDYDSVTYEDACELSRRGFRFTGDECWQYYASL